MLSLGAYVEDGCSDTEILSLAGKSSDSTAAGGSAGESVRSVILTGFFVFALLAGLVSSIVTSVILSGLLVVVPELGGGFVVVSWVVDGTVTDVVGIVSDVVLIRQSLCPEKR